MSSFQFNLVGQYPYCLGPEASRKEKEKLVTSEQLQDCTDGRSRFYLVHSAKFCLRVMFGFSYPFFRPTGTLYTKCDREAL